MALIIGCSSDPSGSKSISAASSAINAMSEAISVEESSMDTENRVSIDENNTFRVENFVAEDGTVITGSFNVGSDGTIIDASLTVTINGQELRFVMENSTEATIDEKPVPPSEIKKTMTKAQRMAFAAFMNGLEEALDVLDEAIMEDWLEDKYEDRRPGTYDIRDNPWLEGTVTVAREERGDDDTEVVAADIRKFRIPLPVGGEISGSFSFSGGEERMKSDIDVSISNLNERDDGFLISLSNLTIDAAVEAGERFDEDYFRFQGLIDGSYSINGENHEIHFDGTMEGEDVAIGRQYRTR